MSYHLLNKCVCVCQVEELKSEQKNLEQKVSELEQTLKVTREEFHQQESVMSTKVKYDILSLLIIDYARTIICIIHYYKLEYS